MTPGLLILIYTLTAILPAAALVCALVWQVHLPKVWAWVTGTLVVLAVGVSVAGLLLARLAGSSRYRLALMTASMGVPWLAYLGLGLAFVSLTNLIWWLATRHRPARAAGPPSRRLPTIRWLTALAVVLSLVTTGYGFQRAQVPAVTPVSLEFANLPANFDGLTIALVSDLHLGATTRDSFVPMLVDQVNAAHPDLIVIAGDLVDGRLADVADRLEPLRNLAAPFGVVATLGNHDLYPEPREWLDFWATLGMRVLANDGIWLERGGQRIEVLGINDRQGQDDLAPDLALALARVETAGAGEQAFRILVAHEPVQAIDDAAVAGVPRIDLQLSGHTHGGQWWPFGYGALLQQPVLDGVHVIDSVTVVTSRGVGTWGPPVRVGSDPEIPLITLRRAG